MQTRSSLCRPDIPQYRRLWKYRHYTRHLCALSFHISDTLQHYQDIPANLDQNWTLTEGAFMILHFVTVLIYLCRIVLFSPGRSTSPDIGNTGVECKLRGEEAHRCICCRIIQVQHPLLPQLSRSVWLASFAFSFFLFVLPVELPLSMLIVDGVEGPSKTTAKTLDLFL